MNTFNDEKIVDLQQEQEQEQEQEQAQALLPFHYRCKVSYNGTHYQGWQIQSGSPLGEAKTIQGEINSALSKLCQEREVYTLGASRTDAGVHSLGQIFRASIPLDLPISAMTKGLNSFLPPEIRILSAEKCDRGFHPRYAAKWKEYVYLFTIDRSDENLLASPFVHNLVAAYPYAYESIKLQAMMDATKLFVGHHDFVNFYCEGSAFKSTKREILRTEMAKVTAPLSSCLLVPAAECWMIRVIGRGFLKQMIRLIVGAIWNVGRGRVALVEIANALGGARAGSDPKLGVVAPACGLYLKQIGFSEFADGAKFSA
ncbi:MAG: tRNA pseudouridine(38-40) synthase TruA [Oligoflexia bacterium]|nr:tRNA pseudouridine(38-40) synthase TruA [Oligoflexia bacterium]